MKGGSGIGDRGHKLDFRKLARDLGIGAVLLIPGIFAGWYIHSTGFFEVCLNYSFSLENGYKCVEQGYTGFSYFGLLAYSVSAAAWFWISLILVYEVFQGLVDRYVVCEDLEEEGGEERSGA